MNGSIDDPSAHISRRYHFDLDAVKTHLLEMGGIVERQVVLAIEAMLAGDSGLAQRVRDGDQQVNTLERAIDEECTRILVCRQPAASDLRLIIAIGKVNADLERIGDEAAQVAKQAIPLSEAFASVVGYPELRAIGQQVCDMLRHALDALARRDVELALMVARARERVDQDCDVAMSALVAAMQAEPRQIAQVLNVIWALRSLARVGDHALNIAEQVIYWVKGADVRHRGLRTMAAQVYGEDG